MSLHCLACWSCERVELIPLVTWRYCDASLRSFRGSSIRNHSLLGSWSVLASQASTDYNDCVARSQQQQKPPIIGQAHSDTVCDKDKSDIKQIYMQKWSFFSQRFSIFFPNSNSPKKIRGADVGRLWVLSCWLLGTAMQWHAWQCTYPVANAAQMLERC